MAPNKLSISVADYINNKKASTEQYASRGYQSNDIYSEPHRHLYYYYRFLSLYHTSENVSFLDTGNEYLYKLNQAMRLARLIPTELMASAKKSF
jgi:hypothetical protein